MSDTSINRFLAQGDDAAEAAFTPDPPTPASGPDPLQLFLNTETTPVLKYWDGANFTPMPGGGSGDVVAVGTLTADTVILGDGATDVKSLANGTAGQVLTMNGGATAPEWAAPSGGGGDFTLIEEKTPSGVGTITFSSLGAFTHLELRWTARSTQAANATNMMVQFNADTGANYDSQVLGSNSTGETSTPLFGQTSGYGGAMPAASATANYGGSGRIEINDYRGTTFTKQWLSETAYVTGTSSTDGSRLCVAGGWRSTAAITSITIVLTSGNYVAGSKFTLYGLT